MGGNTFVRFLNTNECRNSSDDFCRKTPNPRLSSSDNFCTNKLIIEYLNHQFNLYTKKEFFPHVYTIKANA